MASETAAVHGEAGRPIELPIAQGPATGYGWQFDLPDGVERLEDGPPRSAAPGRELGAAIGGALRVQAKHPGRFTITARLARPWGGEPVRTVVIDLTVD